MKEETKMKIITTIVLVGIAGWCFIPCIWFIDYKISENTHFIEGWIYAIVTCSFLGLILYFAKRSIDKHSRKG